MYRVIIVDDEPIIRRGLRETIEWDSLGLEVAGEAADGAQALKLIEAIRPEILITDIRMPEMDGLALIREVRKLDYDVKITILSGYDDTYYLQTAIKLGVDNYLLKPIDNDELIGDLKNAVSEIEKEAEVDLRIRQGSELLRSNTLRRLVTGNISLDELKEKADFLGLSVRAERYICAVCAMGRQSSTDVRERLSRFWVREMTGAVPGGERAAFLDGDGNLTLVTALARAPEGREELTMALDNLVERAFREHGVALMIGAGRPVTRVEDIHLSYESALESLEYGVFMNNSGVIWYNGVPAASLPPKAFDRIDAEKMKSLIRKGDQEGLKAWLDVEINALISESAPPVRQVHNLLMHIAVRMTDCFHELYGSVNANVRPLDFDFSRLFALRRFSDMRLWLFELCDGLFDANAAVLGKSASLAGMAAAYIAEHYREGVSLKQMAADLHVNTSYLGQVFRKETGSAFTDYVNALRIREAQRLLANPALKVYEIAEQVGFTDYHYFLKIFKKVTGTTPRDLRN